MNTLKSHPSLFAPHLQLEDIHPQEKMDPYVPCWCGSGKKWKFCHKDRIKLRPRELGEILARMRTELQQGYCSHPNSGETCSTKIIRSHTVQRATGLAAVAENGHVLSAKPVSSKVTEHEDFINLERVGVNSASTFNGFCGFHDTTMFRPVEVGQPALTNENIFLLSFRALAYELYAKQTALRSVPIQREADYGQPFATQAIIQGNLAAYAQGLRKGIEELIEWKCRYDDMYRKSDWSTFNFYAAEFGEVLPVVASGAFQPEVDFNGRQLQLLTTDIGLDHVVFNLSVLNGVSVAIFGWIGSAAGPAAQIADSFRCIPDADKSSAAIHLAFEHLENTYMRESWWMQLPETSKRIARQLMGSGVGRSDAERQLDSLANRPVRFFDSSVRASLSSN